MVGTGCGEGETENFPFCTPAHQVGILVPNPSDETFFIHVGYVSVSRSGNTLSSQLVNEEGNSPTGWSCNHSGYTFELISGYERVSQGRNVLFSHTRTSFVSAARDSAPDPDAAASRTMVKTRDFM